MVKFLVVLMSKKELCQKKKLQTLDEMRWIFLSVFVFFFAFFPSNASIEAWLSWGIGLPYQFTM